MNKLKTILFASFKSPKLTLKNRIVMSPVPTGFVAEGQIKAEMVEFYRRRAKNVGLIIAGAINIDHPTASNNSKLPYMSSAADLAIWTAVVDAVHKENSKIIAEIWHSGSSRAFSKADLAQNVSSPSGLIGNHKIGEPLSDLEIATIVHKFAEVAHNAKIAGFDGLELHAAHGSLLHDFIAKDTNQRTDQFGYNHRTYLLEHVIRSCRAKIGDSFPLVLRLSNFKLYDLESQLANNLEVLEAIIRPLSEASVDIFDCSALKYSDAAFEHHDQNLAACIKAISGKTVILTGGLASTSKFYDDLPKLVAELRSDPQMAYLHHQTEPPQMVNQADLIAKFEDGQFDLFGFGRPLLINDNWVSDMEVSLK